MKEWQNIFEAKKAELLKSKKTDSRMPEYVYFKFFEGQLPAGTMSMKIGATVPYLEPELIDEFVSYEKCKAVLIIKSQIDHCAGRGVQFRWEGYSIDFSGQAIRIFYETAYELETRSGKEVNCDAIKLFKAL